jgi:hypothetical protein
MPINKRGFFRGEIRPEDALIDLFNVDREKAYTFDELKEMAIEIGMAVANEELEAMLSSLINRGWIVSREMVGQRFYTRRGLGFI